MIFNKALPRKCKCGMSVRTLLVLGVTILCFLQTAYAVSNGKHTLSPSMTNRKTKVVKHHAVTHRLEKRPLTHPVKTSQENPRSITEKIQSTNNQNISLDQRTVRFVHDTVTNMRYSSYKLGASRFDLSRGVYIVDCSSYVDRILKATHPQAFSSLTSWSGNAQPTTHDYYQFFSKLSNGVHHNWRMVDNVEKLRPGDVIVFRYKRETKGHIMILMDKPVRHKNTLQLRITDSAPFRHSQDTRSHRVSGIGIGTMLMKINPLTARPFAYAWQVGARWEKNVAFAMARPTDLPMTRKYFG